MPIALDDTEWFEEAATVVPQRATTGTVSHRCYSWCRFFKIQSVFLLRKKMLQQKETDDHHMKLDIWIVIIKHAAFI